MPDLFQQAVRLHKAGRYSEAEELYRQTLLADPMNPAAWHLLGVLARECGNHEAAVAFITQALEFAPENPDYWNDLGKACDGHGESGKAQACCRRALELRPDFVDAMVSLAAILRGGDHAEEAMQLFGQALRLNPHHADGLLQYGRALLCADRVSEAVDALKRARSADPASVEIRYHLGAAFEANARHGDALACYEQASQLNPKVGEVWDKWGWLLLRMKQFSKGLEVLKQALRCNPDEPDYNYHYGYALQALNRSDEALGYFQRAVARGANSADLHNRLGVAQECAGQLFEAAESFHRALTIQPDMVAALNNFGAVCTDMGLTGEALECIELLIKRQPDSPGAHNNMAKLLKDSGRAVEALASYRHSLALDPNAPEVQHNLLLCYQYLPGLDPKQVFLAHKEWGARLARVVRPAFNHQSRKRHPGQRVRIGYVSPDLCQHPVAVFIEALLAGHDRSKFEVFAYSDVRNPDVVTAHLKSLADVWSNTVDLNHDELAQAIWKDQIDVLVDLCGHTAWNRLEMFALKPAPVQVTYLGYPSTTGLAAMDYRVTDAWADPEGTTEHLHTEQLIRLPVCGWCYKMPEVGPEPDAPPAIRNGHVTFGCFNQLAKLNPALYELWIRILNRVPDSHLYLKAKTLRDGAVKKRVLEFFTARGIDESRLTITGFAKDIRSHLEVYNQVDIALDSFPYHGTTTTCEALWMGAPVVTLAGKTHVSRVGVSLLNAVGLPELIAQTADEYVELAAGLAGDVQRLTALRSSLRSRMLASPLMSAAGLAAAMDDAFMRAAGASGDSYQVVA